MNFRRALLLVSIAVAIVLIVPATRVAILRAAAATLIVKDPIQPADVGVMAEFGEGNELEVSDLYHEKMFSRVVLLEPSPTAVDREYLKRGVYRDDIVRTTLRQLGVPEAAMTTVDAGEGGTTESTHALAAWMRLHPSRAIVVVIPSHTRRFRRALMRVWPEQVTPPALTYPRHNEFRASDWWLSRRTLREGVVELQKLALDYLQHPW
ncbi:MAG TPA: hypothetical protein VFA59_07345 [Vicinamibacterales bacterium]|nr:hypothetical protein [Vicinamibacterales bacterium]